MSVIRRTYLLCDGPLLAPRCAETFGEDHKERTATTHRANAARLGWHRTREGKDLCPACWDALQQRKEAT